MSEIEGGRQDRLQIGRGIGEACVDGSANRRILRRPPVQADQYIGWVVAVAVRSSLVGGLRNQRQMRLNGTIAPMPTLAVVFPSAAPTASESSCFNTAALPIQVTLVNRFRRPRNTS